MANYLTVKDGIADRLKALGYSECSDITDFKNVSANEYGNRYILKCLSGENQNNTIIDRFYDSQEWQVLIAFARSEQSDLVQYDIMQLAKDAIIKDLDKPANWTSFVKMLKYKKWSIEETPNYFVLSITLDIWDIYTY